MLKKHITENTIGGTCIYTKAEKSTEFVLNTKEIQDLFTGDNLTIITKLLDYLSNPENEIFKDLSKAAIYLKNKASDDNSQIKIAVNVKSEAGKTALKKIVHWLSSDSVRWDKTIEAGYQGHNSKENDFDVELSTSLCKSWTLASKGVKVSFHMSGKSKAAGIKTSALEWIQSVAIWLGIHGVTKSESFDIVLDVKNKTMYYVTLGKSEITKEYLANVCIKKAKIFWNDGIATKRPEEFQDNLACWFTPISNRLKNYHKASEDFKILVKSQIPSKEAVSNLEQNLGFEKGDSIFLDFKFWRNTSSKLFTASQSKEAKDLENPADVFLMKDPETYTFTENIKDFINNHFTKNKDLAMDIIPISLKAEGSSGQFYYANNKDLGKQDAKITVCPDEKSSIILDATKGTIKIPFVYKNMNENTQGTVESTPTLMLVSRTFGGALANAEVKMNNGVALGKAETRLKKQITAKDGENFVKALLNEKSNLYQTLNDSNGLFSDSLTQIKELLALLKKSNELLGLLKVWDYTKIYKQLRLAGNNSIIKRYKDSLDPLIKKKAEMLRSILGSESEEVGNFVKSLENWTNDGFESLTNLLLYSDDVYTKTRYYVLYNAFTSCTRIAAKTKDVEKITGCMLFLYASLHKESDFTLTLSQLAGLYHLLFILYVFGFFNLELKPNSPVNAATLQTSSEPVKKLFKFMLAVGKRSNDVINLVVYKAGGPGIYDTTYFESIQASLRFRLHKLQERLNRRNMRLQEKRLAEHYFGWLR